MEFCVVRVIQEAVMASTDKLLEVDSKRNVFIIFKYRKKLGR